MNSVSTTGNIKLLGINLHKSMGPWEAALQKFNEENILCIFAQEVPNIKSDGLHHCRSAPCGANTFYLPSSTRVRSALVLRNHLPAELISEHSCEDIVAVSTKINGKDAILVSAYLDCTADIQIALSRLEKLVQLSKDKLLIIHMDSNARSHL